MGEWATSRHSLIDQLQLLISQYNMARNKSDEACVISALQAIDQNPKLSIREAVRIYSISRSTLKRQYSKISSGADKIPDCRKLADDEEKLLIRYILELNSRAQLSRLRDVEAMANRLLELRHDIPVGRNWVTSFIRRHPKIVTRLSRQIDYQRVQCEDPDKFQAWFELMKDAIAKYGIHEADL